MGAISGMGGGTKLCALSFVKEKYRVCFVCLSVWRGRSHCCFVRVFLRKRKIRKKKLVWDFVFYSSAVFFFSVVVIAPPGWLPFGRV